MLARGDAPVMQPCMLLCFGYEPPACTAQPESISVVARDAGLRSVWFDHIGYPVLPEHPKPDAVIHSYAELLAAIRSFD